MGVCATCHADVAEEMMESHMSAHEDAEAVAEGGEVGNVEEGGE